MVIQKGDTATLLKLVSLFFPCISSSHIFSLMLSPQSSILLIACQPPYFNLFSPLRKYLIIHLTIPNWECLDVSATHGFALTRLINLLPASQHVFFLGYSLTQSAYLCLDTSNSKISVFHHVEFVESDFHFSPSNVISHVLNLPLLILGFLHLLLSLPFQCPLLLPYHLLAISPITLTQRSIQQPSFTLTNNWAPH